MSPQLALLLIQALNVVYWVVIADVLLSWVIRDPTHPVKAFTHRLTEPIVGPLRPFLTVGAFDLSPIAVLFGVQLVQRAIASSAM